MSTRVKSFAVGALALTIAAAAQAQPEKERVIIGFKAGSAAQVERAVNAAGGKKEVDLQRFGAVAVSVPTQALKGLQNNPNVLYVEEDTRRQLLSTEFEPGKPYGIEMVQADLVSDGVAGNRKVCIIDSGYDLGHPDLQSSGVDGVFDSGTGNWYTDENGHGTHVAGTIAALANGEGVVGVMPNNNINLHIVKVFGADGWSYSSSLVAAAEECANYGANVINMSLGGSRANRTEDRAFTQLNNEGILSIAAAGNDGNTRDSYPASYDAVVSVAAIDANEVVASFSQQTAQVELAGPGVSVLSSVPRGTGERTELTVSGIAYNALAMDGTPKASATGNVVDCGLGEQTCTGATGAVCLIERGNISFAEKVQACEAGGGVGAVIYNNEAGPLLGTMGEVVTSIPSVGVSDTDGATLLSEVGNSATVAVEASDWAFFDGTSMATPHVVGVAALVWSHFPECSNNDIRSALNASAKDLGATGRDNAYGHGLVQTQGAVDYLTANGCSGSVDDGGGSDGGDTGGPGKGNGKGGKK
ncbi:PA domain-containing protein [Pseudidiomarina planktonica]|uniref:PA domain-containing protein n=1 Tax=Pseudidiomarina planktonica TaxID=1323738 RepID=A0A1Y6FWP6_9GAMM|nr:S8 family serine peptidase [Pseudidiomarina planktonica]RUO63799.1 peptidase S8 [Pseudidiomarina planktonica]SMQ80137.1 PA domain-containing protein [Pseudidiomarina planktonica]